MRKTSPIQTLKDLEGKKLAFKRGSSAHNLVAKALRKGGLAPTDVALAKITRVKEDMTRVALTRPDFSLGNVSTITDGALAHQQALADEFYGLGILPKKLTIADIVWRPKGT